MLLLLSSSSHNLILFLYSVVINIVWSLTLYWVDFPLHQVFPDSQSYFLSRLDRVYSTRPRDLQFPHRRDVASEQFAQREEKGEQRSDDDRHEGEEDVLVAEGDGLDDPEVPVGAVHPLVPDAVDDAGLQQLEDVVVEEGGELGVLLQRHPLVELHRLVDVQRLYAVVGPGPGWQFNRSKYEKWPKLSPKKQKIILK